MESSHHWSIQHHSDVKRDLQKEIDGLYSLQYLFGGKKKKSLIIKDYYTKDIKIKISYTQNLCL